MGFIQAPLQVNLFMCATRLHNFCINKGDIENGRTDSAENTMPVPCDVIPIPIGNNAVMREIVADGIVDLGLLWPSYNLECNGL